ncbi:MAG: FTR1 family protein [Acidobacteria bacterium]|nr:FTR1 family protein [Acidobacteriota bacterium]
MFSNFLIGLREGLEASLIVGILVAYLVKTGRTEHLRAVWAGVAVAVVASLGFVAVLQITSNSLSDEAAEAFAGVMSILTVVFLTWMIFWMRRTAHTIKGDLHERMDSAFAGGAMAMAVLAAVAVGREGLETALFLWTNDQATSGAGHPAVGGILGLAVSVLLGFLIYRRAVHFNLSSFFTITGVLLIIVAAGVLTYAVHEFQEVGWLPGEYTTAFQLPGWYDQNAWYGSLLAGLFNIRARMSVLEVIAWFAYLVPVMGLFFRGAKPRAAAPVAPASSADQPSVEERKSTTTRPLSETVTG